MTIERMTKISSIDLNEDGTIGVRFVKQLLEDGVVIWKEPHRGTIGFEGSVEDHLDPIIEHLGKLGFTSPSSAELALIQTVADTPFVAAVRNTARDDDAQRKKLASGRAEKETTNTQAPGVKTTAR